MSENVRTEIDVTGPLQTRTQIKPASHKPAHPVLAAHNWKQNSDMIADAAKLGYLDGAVLDLSYGHGKFWKQWRPNELTANDLDPTKGRHHFDVNDPAPDHWVEAFNAVVWDGPYRLSGTRDRGDFDEQYGLGKPVNANETMALLRAGVDFAALCTRPGGHVLIKSQPQVVSGRKVWQPRRLVEHGEKGGLTLVDELFLVRPPRPQPAGRRQVHSRSNYSVLSIMRKPKTKGANRNRGETSTRQTLL